MRAVEINARGKTLPDAKVAFMEQCKSHRLNLVGFGMYDPRTTSPHRDMSVVLLCEHCVPFNYWPATRSINVTHLGGEFWLLKLIFICPTCN